MSLGSPTVISRDRATGPAHGSVTIIRDEYGVPHVFGATLEAVWFGVGYAQAQDRLWQAELLRRTATGTSAEILGPSALEGDKFAPATSPIGTSGKFQSPPLRTPSGCRVSGADRWNGRVSFRLNRCPMR